MKVSLYKKNSINQPKNIFFIFSFFYWSLVIHVPLANYGGYGLDIPINLYAWLYVGLVVIFIWLNNFAKNIAFSISFYFIFAGSTLMTIPVLWSNSSGVVELATPRLLGIWAGAIFYFTLLQLKPNEAFRRKIILLMTISTSIACFYSFFNMFFPSYLTLSQYELLLANGRNAIGIFQQVNVTASFLATGLCFLIIFNSTSKNDLIFISTSIMIILFVTALTVFNSRTGWLGGLSIIIGTYFLFISKKFHIPLSRRFYLISLSIFGVIVGIVLEYSFPIVSVREYMGSSTQRWLTLKYTFQLILEHPIKGWGLGMYEVVFQEFMSNLPGINPSRGVMQHPHNETLFIWAEGGIVALIGGFCYLVAYIRLIIKAQTFTEWAIIISTLPILLHTQLEFPFYYSVPHFLTILMLLASVDTASLSKDSHHLFKLRSGFSILGLIGIILVSWTFYCTKIFNELENRALSEPKIIRDLNVPFFLKERLSHEKSLMMLLEFQNTKNPVLLYEFMQLNDQWLLIQCDSDMYLSKINVLRYLDKNVEADAVEKKAKKLFPMDDRF